MPAFIDLTGKKFNRLLVIRRAANRSTNTCWVCLCDCGNTVEVLGCKLKGNKTKSCGCYFREIAGKSVIKHGLSKTPTYRVWKAVIQRCLNPKNKSYNQYGGRGIGICDHWNPNVTNTAFSNFLEDMGERPVGLSLDRIDVNGNYCKENCRWATWSVQGYNQRMKNTNTSGRTGVYWHTRDKCWEAYIGFDRDLLYLGRFDTFDEAVEARVSAELKYFGELKK